MWHWERERRVRTAEPEAQLGRVTLSGDTAVNLGGERRGLLVCTPGGILWRPGDGEQVLVLKTGEQGESACVLARQETPEEDLQPGEVELYAPDCRVKLTGTGRVELCGSIYINGQPLEDVIRRAVAGQEG